MANSNLFNPILGSEKRVLAQDTSPGAVYFTTDTRKIYLDIDENHAKLPMGGNIGLFYGKMKLTIPAPPEQKEFNFSLDDIIKNADDSLVLQPNVNDLILNQDGCFYKVISSFGEGDDITLQTEKLTIAGSGNVNNGPSSGDSLSGSSMTKLKVPYPAVIYGQSCPISFAVQVTDDLGDPLRGYVGTYTIYIDSQQITGKVIGATSGNTTDISTINPEEIMTIDVGPYLPLSDSTLVTVQVVTNTGVSFIRTANISTTNMALTWDYNEDTLNVWESKDSSLKLEWEISGTTFSKTTYIIIDGDTSRTIKVTDPSLTKTKFDYNLNFSDYGLYHGAHTIKMWAESSIGNATTEPIYKNFLLIRGSTSPIISVGLYTKDLKQYNTIAIPIKIYDSFNTANTQEIKMFVNGAPAGEFLNVANFEINEWTFTPTIYGNDIPIQISCNGSSWNQRVNIEKIDIDITEEPGYAYKFKANEFANNNGVKEWKSGGYDISFSEKFDWINGGLKTEKDENGETRQYFMVKAGSTMTINYPLWARNAAATGKHLKFIFKATNCRDYDAQVLATKTDKQVIRVNKSVEYLFLTEDVTSLTYSDSLSRSGYNLSLRNPVEGVLDINDPESRKLFKDKYVKFGDDIYQCGIMQPSEEEEIYYAAWYKASVEDSFNGLLMRAQNAFFRTEGKEMETQYCEDHYIEFELEVTENPRYIKMWIDGVPCGYTNYSSTEIFSGANSITIGSSECDVCVYLLKIYEKELPLEAHMQNFYIDASNANEMINRFKRNDILYSSNSNKNANDIDPMKLAKANKDCLVHMYTIPRMTKTKKDEVYPCSYSQYKGDTNVKYTANNVMIKVQGTSSEQYVVAAANIDTDFNYTKNGNVPTGLRDSEGNKLPDGWSMDDGNAIPVNYTCTKVNVASCENANNALNQEWYNLFQPYKSVLRCKNPRARDTMQFTNGVIFMTDKNQTFDTAPTAEKKENNLFGEVEGYLKNPYAKMYSIGQMGNSKDNTHVFHDESNPLECCVEVRDNQTPQQWMVSDDYNKEDIGEGKKYFEFRYPEGVEDVKKRGENGQRMIDGWNRLVHWFAHSNPSPKYNKHENITTLDQYRDFSINKRTRQPIDVYVMRADQTAYDKIEGFDPSINVYYTETEHVYGHTNLLLDEPETYEQKQLHGFRAENQKREDGTLWQSDYIPIVSTFNSIKEYAGTYTHDTYERRMAKMLEECEDYLIMDSVLYHYLFIERHCMIDNVAKNTFWSTEDCMHWALIKDYDNDTSDGNDNNGKFTRTYGMEVMDRLNPNMMVFNAHQSVWLNFIDGLHEAREQMYEQLASAKAVYKGREVQLWNASHYLQAFKEWQAIIPERCWIEDYRRKYFRPSELYNNNMFNEMIEGGQKKYQRAQYETYQDIYMSSEYNSSTNSGSFLWFRPTGSGLNRVRIPVTTYSDCYVRMEMGSDTSKERVKRNTIAYIQCPADNLNNATMKITPAKNFVTIGDINNVSGQIGTLSPDIADFAGAPKLRELIFATSDNTTFNNGLEGGVAFTGNNLLEKLYITNLQAYKEGLDLSGCPSLLEVDASDSTFTDITIASGAPLQKATLQSPTSLSLSNLTDLQELIIRDKTKLTTINIENIDDSIINSKDIVTDVLDTLIAIGNEQPLRYKLTQVKWKINSDTEITDNNIPLLDKLLDTNRAIPVIGADKLTPIPYTAALTGSLHITKNAYNGSNGLKLYTKYIVKENADDTKYFGNLEMSLETNNSILHNVIIYDGNDTVFWKKKASPNTELTTAFLQSGPNGAFNASGIYKTSTEQYVYTFLNQWDVKDDDGNLITTLDGAQPVGISINKNIHLYPKFSSVIRTYRVFVKSKHPITGAITTWREGIYDYGTSLQDVLPYRETPYIDSDASGLTLYQAYDCKGYSLSEDSKIFVSELYTVKNDDTLWAVFELEEDIRDIVHYEWFEGRVDKYDMEAQTFGIKEGIIISPKNVTHNGITSRFLMHDKITLPATFIIDGIEKPVIGVENFEVTSDNPHAVKYIFMDKNKTNSLYDIKTGAFKNLNSLRYFDFDNSAIRYIRKEAFYNNENLTNTSFGNSLYRIGESAFNGALTSNGEPTVLTLPSSLRIVDKYGFGLLKVAKGSTLVIGHELLLSDLDLLDCSTSAFQMNTFYKYKSVVFYSKTYDDADVAFVNPYFENAILPKSEGGAITIY